MRFNAFSLSVILCLVAVFAGCQSHSNKSYKFNGQVRKITLESEPSGASVYRIDPITGGRSLLGQTPLREQSVFVITDVKFSHLSPSEMVALADQVEMVRVAIENPGYKTYSGNLSTKRDGGVAEHKIVLEKP